jgi:hypothetical protein
MTVLYSLLDSKDANSTHSHLSTEDSPAKTLPLSSPLLQSSNCMLSDSDAARFWEEIKSNVANHVDLRDASFFHH